MTYLNLKCLKCEYSLHSFWGNFELMPIRSKKILRKTEDNNIVIIIMIIIMFMYYRCGKLFYLYGRVCVLSLAPVIIIAQAFYNYSMRSGQQQCWNKKVVQGKCCWLGGGVL